MRTVIVSGGSRGLGRAIVEGFLRQTDYCVAAFSRRKTEFIEAISSDPVLYKRLFFDEIDMTDRSAISHFVDDAYARFGSIDVLVNNASQANDGVLAVADEEAMDALIDIDIKSAIHLTRVCIRKMLLSQSGRIINISSIVGMRGYKGLSVYSAAKAAMDGFTRSLAHELGSRSITVNSVAPGYMNTKMTQSLTEEQRGQVVRRTPLGRLGTPEDIVPLVLFLCSDGGSFMTGQTLVIDGGLTV